MYQAASQCLISILSESVKDDLLLYTPSVDEKVFKNVDEIISQIAKTLSTFYPLDIPIVPEKFLRFWWQHSTNSDIDLILTF